MLISVDASSTTPLHEQLATALRRAVETGELAPGERLLSARRMAQELQVNMHTVLRSYASLRDERLVEFRRGRGAVVCDRVDAGLPPAVLRALGNVLRLAEQHGVARERLAAAIRAVP